MKAVVFHALGDIRLDDVPEPEIKEPTDAIVRLTSSAAGCPQRRQVSGLRPVWAN